MLHVARGDRRPVCLGQDQRTTCAARTVTCQGAAVARLGGDGVAAALVGTFLGILVSYGFAGPIAARVELMINDSGAVFNAVKVALLAYAKDCSPKVCVEFARRSIPPEVRPTFEEVDKATSGAGKGGGAAAA
jgi:chemotaxis protein MotA